MFLGNINQILPLTLCSRSPVASHWNQHSILSLCCGPKSLLAYRLSHCTPPALPSSPSLQTSQEFSTPQVHLCLRPFEAVSFLISLFFESCRSQLQRLFLAGTSLANSLRCLSPVPSMASSISIIACVPCCHNLAYLFAYLPLICPSTC